MASIHKDKRSRYWQAAWRDAGGRQFIRSTKIEHSPFHEDPKERAALAARNKRVAAEAAGRFEAEARGNPVENQLRSIVTQIAAQLNGETLVFARADTFLGDWLKRCEKTKEPSSFTRYKGVITAFLANLGPKASGPLVNITSRDVETFTHSRLEAGRNPSTLKVDLKILNTPFALALRQGIIGVNPVAAAEKVSGEQESREPFTLEEVSTLLKATSSDEWRTMILLGAYAGLRISDCSQITWTAIDLPRKLMRFRPAKTKGKKRDLVIPIHPALEKHLLSLSAPDDPDAPISPTLSVMPVGSRSGLSQQFNDIVKDAGIEQITIAATGKAGRAFNKRSFHSLRHTFVTALENAGVAPDLRMKLAGHTSAAVHGRYTHSDLETLSRAINAVPGYEQNQG